jgi:hypothetical protein
MTVLVCVLLLAPGISQAGFNFPPRHIDGMTATLALQVPEQGPAPGLARVQLTLQVRGPGGLAVQYPRLEDALAAWRVEWSASSWSSTNEEALCEQTLALVQVKPGVVPLPGVTVRLRSAPGETWQDVSWPDLLREERDVPGPEQVAPPPPSPWPARLRVAGVSLVAILLLALLLFAGRRWRAARQRPLTADQRALARLAAAPADSAQAVTHLDGVLRQYLDERFGVEASRKTTAEVLAALAEKGEPATGRNDLAELLAWGDLAKFAPQSGPEDLQRIRERMGEFVRITASGEEKRKEKERKSR